MSLAAQGIVFTAMFSLGLLIGAWADFLKVITVKRPKYLIACGDLFFWLSVALLVILVLFNLNYLELRFYAFASALLGVWVYYKLLSKHFCRFYRGLLRVSAVGFRYLSRLSKPVTLPPRFIARVFDSCTFLLVLGIVHIVFKIQDFLAQRQDITPPT